MSLLSFFSKKPTEPTSVEEALAGTAKPSSRSKHRKEKNNADSAESIPEKKRARRRLIGAVAMVLAVVLGLPMILDSEPRPLDKNIAIQISSVDESPAVLESPKTPPLPAAVEEEPASNPSEVEKEVEKKRELTSTDQPKTNEVVEKKEAKTKPVSEKTVDQTARALAILNGEDATPAKPKTRIVVQVGAFATQAKVDELRKKLTRAGIKSYTQKIATSSGDKIRVRIGPFEDKESADKVKTQLQKLGINSSLITL